MYIEYSPSKASIHCLRLEKYAEKQAAFEARLLSSAAEDDFTFHNGIQFGSN